MDTKINISSILLCARRYWMDSSINSELRMGQYLMNELVPGESNPSIYYEDDDHAAVIGFCNTYGDYSL